VRHSPPAFNELRVVNGAITTIVRTMEGDRMLALGEPVREPA
jgi:hypothetical protein